VKLIIASTLMRAMKKLTRSRSLVWSKWPLPSVHLGVSVENQETADERIPTLLPTPAAVRFLSVQPLLELVDLSCVEIACK
jgi:protein gp37